MEYFTQKELDFFATLKKQPYKNSNLEHREIGNDLKNTGVYAKTRYWASLLKDKGYIINTKDQWQTSGYFRSYTWAKILLPGVDNQKVFFTIGVGSRLSKGKQEAHLEYKLDCQRSNSGAIDPSMEYIFDKYMADFCDTARSQMLTIDDARGWDELVDITLEFFRAYHHNYLEVATLTEINEKNLPKRIVRLCWNTNKWEKPSGADGKSKAKDHAFERDKGYGYEEWLFNPNFRHKGYNYGFIQAFHKGGHHGNSFEISAYAMENKKNTSYCYWIGKINRLEVLTIQQQEEAIAEFEKLGWLEQMRFHLQDIGIADFNFKPINPDEIINVRFKSEPDNWTRYDKPMIIDNPKDELGGNRHYVLLPKKGKTIIDDMPVGTFTFKEGHKPAKTGMVPGKRKKVDYLMLLKHKEIQTNIYNQLMEDYAGTRKRIGTENVTVYGKSIDLAIECPTEGITFYEIKTYGSALHCIREAIGQLFEYTYYSDTECAERLVIIGLEQPNQKVKQYMQHLRKLLTRSIYYQWYQEETDLLQNELY